MTAERDLYRRRFFPGLRITLIALPIVFIFLAGFAAYCAPRFLAYTDRPVRSDALILFVGNDAVRRKEANRLLDEGYARFLIIPAFHQVFMEGNIPFQPPASAKTNPRSTIRISGLL